MFVGSNRNTPHKMSTKHTPGPWTVSPSAKASTLTRVFDKTGKLVASANGPGLSEGGEAESNARLIAAAPDMLQALLVLRSYFEGKGQIPNALAPAIAAIAKATNETL